MNVTETELIVNDSLRIPLAEMSFQYVRSSGPGGQNVNKVNSQAQLSWPIGEHLPTEVRDRLYVQQRTRITKENVLRVDSQRYRDREKNRLDCLNRLREMLVQAATPPVPRKKTKIPKGVKERRLRAKSQRSAIKKYRRTPKLDD